MTGRPIEQKSRGIILAYLVPLLAGDTYRYWVWTLCIGPTHSWTPPNLSMRHQPKQLSLEISLGMAIENVGRNRNSANSHDDQCNVMKPQAPCIAIVTEQDACDNNERYEATMKALYLAISTNCVAFISIRLSRDYLCTGTTGSCCAYNTTSDNRYRDNHEDETQFQSRYIRMIQQLREWSCSCASTTARCYVVVSSGPYMELGLQHYADGVHFKELHQSQIPSTRRFYQKLLQDDDTSATNHMKLPRHPSLLVGTSVHSIASALEAYKLYQPDYMFVGTCFTTQSHPEKRNVEGPQLPSQVYDTLHRYYMALSPPSRRLLLPPPPSPPPLILGIGGIDVHNCGMVVHNNRHHNHLNNPPPNHNHTMNTARTCDGVAVIRAVLQSIDPAQTVRSMYRCIIMAHGHGDTNIKSPRSEE